MTVGLISLGCSKNRVDSELALSLLQRAGYTLTQKPEEAEVLIVNTCGFIESAKQESIDTIFEMNEFRQTGKCRALIATGCLAQRYGEQLFEDMPELDAVVGLGDYPRLPEIVAEALAGRRQRALGGTICAFDGARVLTTPSYSAYVRISDGCDNRCAYCAIPLIRGGYRSRPYDAVLAECEALAQAGASELTLIAQDTSRYGNDFPERTLLLPKLLRAADALEGVHWLRVLYCYPDTVTDELLDVMASLPKACRYLDLPIQHIDDEVLRRMNRRGSSELIRGLLAKCRERGILVRTTLITGFPGETEEAFSRLLDFVEEARFDRLGAFAYSAEDDTPACAMPDQVPEEVREERLDRVMTLQQAISKELCAKRVGETCETLVEGVERGRYYGRSRLEAPEIDGKILFRSEKPLTPGQYVPVKITRSSEYDLLGEAIR